MAQVVKNLPEVWEAWVWSLDWEDSLEEGIETHSSILARRIPMDRGVQQATFYGVARSWTWLSKSPIVGFPGGTTVKEPTCQYEMHKKREFSPCTRKIPGGGHYYTLQYSCLENSHGQRRLWRVLQSIGSQRAGHDWSNLEFMHTSPIVSLSRKTCSFLLYSLARLWNPWCISSWPSCSW